MSEPTCVTCSHHPHRHDFRTWNLNDGTPPKRICQADDCPGGFDTDPEHPTPPRSVRTRPEPLTLPPCVTAKEAQDIARFIDAAIATALAALGTPSEGDR